MNIVISGASMGLGAALALLYAREGVVLGLIGRDEERLDAVGKACWTKGATVVTARLDVRDAPLLGTWISRFDRTHPIDLLIANAGISRGADAEGNSEGLTAFTQQIAVNLLGAANLIEPLLPEFMHRKSGHIALISSIAGLRGLPYSPGYCASKAGMRVYGEALRAYLRPHGVDVSVVCPGFFDTEMSRQFRGQKFLMIPVERAAEIIKHGLDRRQSRIQFPQLLGFGLRAADLLPARLGDALLRRFRFHIAHK